jgi:hypothetical protein
MAVMKPHLDRASTRKGSLELAAEEDPNETSS